VTFCTRVFLGHYLLIYRLLISQCPSVFLECLPTHYVWSPCLPNTAVIHVVFAIPYFSEAHWFPLLFLPASLPNVAILLGLYSTCLFFSIKEEETPTPTPSAATVPLRVIKYFRLLPYVLRVFVT
jgi:hypothetical protein